ncbi:MAG TPA: RNA polymerase sigma factor [Bacteroidales bacterium]|nr:RNA polymerase sigma factor [Bacteroidales bacterium]
MTVGEYNKSVEAYADHIYRFILGSVKDAHRADDIVQDTYERLWMHLTEIDFIVVKSWLFSTSYHIMIDIIRKEKRISGLEDLVHEPEFNGRGYSDLNEILHRAIEKLPEIQKTSILLRDYEGYSYKEIGEITGQNESQVKINIYRGRIALKNYIGSIESILES